MSGRIAAASTFAACVLIALIGFRDDSDLLPYAAALAVIGMLASRHHRALQNEAILRAHGLKRLQIGRDSIYVERHEDE